MYLKLKRGQWCKQFTNNLQIIYTIIHWITYQTWISFKKVFNKIIINYNILSYLVMLFLFEINK